MGIENRYSIKQSSRKSPRKENYFDWEIWLDDGEHLINKIKFVEYILHSSFPNRIRKRTNVADNFRLQTSGWGEFMILIHIVEKDGQTFEMSHWLNLGNNISKDDYNDELKKSSRITPPNAEGGQSIKKMFLSYDNANARMAAYIESLLNNLGIEVTSSSNVEKGKSIKDSIEKAITDSDAVLMIKGSRPSYWQGQEIDITDQKGKKQIVMDESEIDRNEITYGLFDNNLKMIAQKLNIKL